MWQKIKNRLQYYRKVFNINKLDTLIFFVTSKCNGCCRTCFYWRNLTRSERSPELVEGRSRTNSPPDLSLSEIEEICRTIPRFNQLFVSGGEPFLRNDLAEIVHLFYRYNGIKGVSIPTNGSLSGYILRITKEILQNNQDLAVTVAFSLDGLEKTNDYIRNQEGSFKRSIKSLQELQQLKQDFPNLYITVTTVICAENYRQIPELGEFVYRELNVCQHHFELIRGEIQSPDLKEIPDSAIADLLDYIGWLQWRYYRKQKRHLLDRVSEFGLYLLGRKVEFLNWTKKRWPFPCLAGRTIAVLEPDGLIRACELRKTMGNVLRYANDSRSERSPELVEGRSRTIRNIWRSEMMEQERENIKKEKCYCTHGCFIGYSMKHNPKAYFVLAPLEYVKFGLRNFWRRGKVTPPDTNE